MKIVGLTEEKKLKENTSIILLNPFYGLLLTLIHLAQGQVCLQQWVLLAKCIITACNPFLYTH